MMSRSTTQEPKPKLKPLRIVSGGEDYDDEETPTVTKLVHDDSSTSKLSIESGALLVHQQRPKVCWGWSTKAQNQRRVP